MENNPQPPFEPSSTASKEELTQSQRSVTLDLGSGSSAEVKLHLSPGSTVKLTVDTLSEDGRVLQSRSEAFHNPGIDQQSAAAEGKKPSLLSRIPKVHWPSSLRSWPAIFLAIAMVVYLVVRLVGLESFPIYFFTDEAIQTVLAQDLVRDGMHSYTGELLPTYMENGSQLNLSTSVYIQVIPYLIFGKSIWVTRGVAVLFSLLAAAAIGLIFKNIFKTPYAFLGILVLSAVPAWFLHSRTAFETALSTSFYAVFLYCYLMYRRGKLKYLFAAVVFGALCFYSYSPAQMVMLVSAVGLFFSDLRYHWKKRRHVILAILIGVMLAIPYFRFLYLHPGANLQHMQILNSYWVMDMPFSKKIGTYFAEYGKMINPAYWFTTSPADLARHIMKGYGRLLWWSAPLAAIGLGKALLKLRKPEYRSILIAVIASPNGAALSGAGITRTLFMVIPAAILITLGLIQVLEWIEKKSVSKTALAGILLALFIALNGIMLRDALVNGPTWYEDYTLNGMQYGAKEVFGEIKQILKEHPEEKIMLSSSWANGTDVLARYFFQDPVPFELGSIDGWLFEQKDISPESLFILMSNEYDRAVQSGKFKEIKVEKIMNYPDGKPGFYFVRLAYREDIAEILKEEKAQRSQLQRKEISSPELGTFSILYPQMDMGEIENLFDGDPNSVVRTLEANPMKLVITFARPQTLSEVVLRIGGTATTITLTAKPENGQNAVQMTREIKESNELRDITLNISSSETFSTLTVEVKNTYDSEPAHVHLWELDWK